MSEDNKLSQAEAKLVADYLRQKGKELPKGWVSLWKLSPSKIADQYGVKVADVISAARRN